MTTRWTAPLNYLTQNLSRGLVRGVLLGALLILGLSVTAGAQPGPGAPASADLAAPLLQPGASGGAVRQLQLELAEVGLYPGPVDGLYGTATVQAVRSLQQQQGLAVDGVAGAQTWQALAELRRRQALALPPSPLGADLLGFTPLVVAQPAPPPSALWLALMPLVPIAGGALTYLYRGLRRRQRVLKRRRLGNPLPPRLPR